MPGATFLGVSLKMYFDHETTLRWVTQVADRVGGDPGVLRGRVRVAVLPTFVSLDAARRVIGDRPIGLGAQDLSSADSGPYTGEVSGRDLSQLGCRYAEVGHAERRRHFGEDDAMVAAKLAAAVRNGLTPILCVGEESRSESGRAARICVEQAEAALARLPGPIPELIVAYEPVWAIGADRPATTDHIQTVCRQLREQVPAGPGGGRPSVIYGGSGGPGLLTSLGDVLDGLFLGRFAHDPAALQQMIAEAES